MIDLTVDRAIGNDMQKLVSELSQRWADDLMKPVHADMQYGQYAEALLNIIAISLTKKMKLKTIEVQKIEIIVRKMKIEQDVKSMINHLSKTAADLRAHENEGVMALVR